MPYPNQSYSMDGLSSKNLPTVHNGGNISSGSSRSYTASVPPVVTVLQPSTKARLQSRLDGVLALSVVVCVFVNLVFGIIAFFFAIRARRAASGSKHSEAWTLSKMAIILSISGACVTAFLLLLMVILVYEKVLGSPEPEVRYCYNWYTKHQFVC